MDNSTAPWDIKKSPFYTKPEKFLKLGQRVRAKLTVYDLPGTDSPGPMHALVGEEGVVVHVQTGHWPTVRFDRTGSSTCVTDFEVEAMPKPKLRFIDSPGMPWHGCKVSVTEGRGQEKGMVKAKLMEPTNAPAIKVGDTLTLMASEIAPRRPGYG